MSTLDVVVTKPNQAFCRVRWSFTPRAGRSYLVAARGEPGGCSVSLLDATDPDDIRTEIREAAAMAEAGLETDDVYNARSNAAFAGLASVTL